MKVFHLPRWINSLNDVVALEHSAYMLMKYARRNDKMYREAKKVLIPTYTYCTCGLCDSVGMEVHHIKPIWASAVEYIMSFSPRSTSDANSILKICGRIELEGAVNEWHSPKNLIVLCRECHLKQQSVDDLTWRRKLAIQHRLAFSLRWADLFARESYRQSPKCPVELQEYIDWYLEREYQMEPTK